MLLFLADRLFFCSFYREEYKTFIDRCLKKIMKIDTLECLGCLVFR